MPTNYKNEKFQCSLAPLMEQFIHEKRACGYKYRAEARLLDEAANAEENSFVIIIWCNLITGHC
jgi:hypothetical protein